MLQKVHYSRRSYNLTMKCRQASTVQRISRNRFSQNRSCRSTNYILQLYNSANIFLMPPRIFCFRPEILASGSSCPERNLAVIINIFIIGAGGRSNRFRDG